MTYEQWVDFTFRLGDGQDDLGLIDYTGTASDAIEHCEHFFRDPIPVLSNVPYARATAVLWIIPSIDGYGGLMASPRFVFPEREKLADLQFDLFAKAFVENGYGGAAFMWWEHLIGAEWDGGPSVRDDREMCDHMINLLARILEIPSEECERSALHGLNEFGPNSSDPAIAEDIIRRLLGSNRSLSPEVREYAAQVLAGDAQ